MYQIRKKIINEIADISSQTLWRKLQDSNDKSDQTIRYMHIDVAVARQILSHYFFEKYSPKFKVQTFFNFKGGTGKTTLAYNVSHIFSLMGYKVLVIDCDPQAHLSRSVCGDSYQNFSLYEVVAGEKRLDEVINKRDDYYSIIPSSIKLTFFDSLVQNNVSREKTLSKLLEPLKLSYDFIFIDVNPSINQLNRNAIIASDVVNIISEAQPYSFYGMEILLQEFKQLAEISKDNKINFNVILNKVEPRSSINVSIANALKAAPELADHLVDHIVRKSEDFPVSAKEATPVVYLNNRRSANAVQDIIGLSKELLALSTTPIC